MYIRLVASFVLRKVMSSVQMLARGRYVNMGGQKALSVALMLFKNTLDTEKPTSMFAGDLGEYHQLVQQLFPASRLVLTFRLSV